MTHGNDTIRLGVRRYQDQAGFYGVEQGDLPVYLSQADRRHHHYIVGKTGTGKSTLLKNLVIQDLEAGRGVALIDPHGDLAEAVLGYVPKYRTREVVYFNPADVDRPVGFNLLRQVPRDQRPLVASTVISAFKSIWSDSWGPRLEYILYNAVAALLEVPQTTLLSVIRILTDDNYRLRITEQVRDPVVRRFWAEEFASYDKRFRTDASAPILNKVGQLLSHPPIRNILGQKKSSFDPRFTMDRGRIFIANLSKGRIGEAGANLLGSLLVAYFGLAAMQRVDVQEDDRRDFHLFVDEFQNFTTTAFPSILSEARKYRLCLILAHQYLDQLPDDVRLAVFGNVGTLQCFRVGNRDGAFLAGEMGERTRAEDLTALARFKTQLRHPEHSSADRPLVVSTELPEAFEGETRRRRLVRHSRERFGASRVRLERQIARWMGV